MSKDMKPKNSSHLEDMDNPLSRRAFLRSTAAAGTFLAAGVAAPGLLHAFGSKPAEGPFTLPALPFAPEALAPYISEKTISFHYGKHHAGYVKKLNGFIRGSLLEKMTLEEIIADTAGNPARASIFNNAAQVYNHTLYWNSMKPGGGGPPTGKMKKKIEASFGSYENFRKEFARQAAGLFGSGWVYLVAERDVLYITSGSNADTPAARGKKPILTIDVWEHAYYLDYQNRRKEYINAWLDNLTNWDFAQSQCK